MKKPMTWRARREARKHDTAWGASKRTFATTLVAIALNPVSAAVGYYMNYWLQRPAFEIANVNFVYDVKSREFPLTAWEALRGNAELFPRLRDTLTKLAADPASASCVAWLEKRSEWHDACAALVHSVVVSFIDADNRELTALKEAPGEHAGSAAAGGAQASLERNLRELASLEHVVLTLNAGPTVASRTGNVTLQVGVINTGDKDGVIANRARLETRDGELWLATDNYATVKAHSVSYIDFVIAGAANPRTLQAFRGRVRNGERAPITIALDSLPGVVSKRLFLETGA
jgi:hypothetical protein